MKLKYLIVILSILSVLSCMCHEKGDRNLAIQFSNIIVFGDGLSDMGKFGELTNFKYPPSPPFYQGRWTNGPTWIETLAEKIHVPIKAENNFAMGGATTGHYNINEPLRTALGLSSEAELLGLQAQIDKAIAAAPKLDSSALYVVWAGGHDYGNFLEYGQPDIKQYPPATNIQYALTRLISAGAHTIMVGDLPDLGITPAYAGTEKATLASRLIQEFNDSLWVLIQRLESSTGKSIILMEIASFFKDVFANPAHYGLKNVNESYLPYDYIDFSNPLKTPEMTIPNREQGLNPDEFAFWWGISASKRIHDLIAERAIEAMNKKLN